MYGGKAEKVEERFIKEGPGEEQFEYKKPAPKRFSGKNVKKKKKL